MGTSRFITAVLFYLCMVKQNAAMTTDPMLQRTSMAPTDLADFNREVRTALLEKVKTELLSAKTYMASLEPQLTDCRVKVNDSLGSCAQCVDTECQKRYKDCQTLSVHMNTNGGSSISTSNINGQSQIQICSMVASARTCNVIMNPDGFLVNGISQIGNSLQINFGRLTHDLGNGFVGSFVNGLQVVSGGNFNGSTMSKEEAAQFNAQMQNLQANLHNMGHNIQQSMQGMASNLHQSLSGMGQHMQQWGSNFAHQLSSSLANMFHGSWLGGWRKRRAVPRYCDVLMSDITSCSMFTSQCASCPSTVSSDLMTSVCGATLVNQVQAAEKSMDQLDQISREVMSTSNIVTQVKGFPLNQVPAVFSNAVVIANIRGTPTLVTANSNIDTGNLHQAGRQMANQIWKEWAISTAHP